MEKGSGERNQQDFIRVLALEGCSLVDAKRGLEILKGWGAEQRYVDDYLAAARERWPEANVFEEGRKP